MAIQITNFNVKDPQTVVFVEDRHSNVLGVSVH